MSPLTLLLCMAASVYAIRLSGFVVGAHLVPASLRQALQFTPIAVFAALVVAGLASRPDEWSLRLSATLVAGLVVHRTRQLWAGILVGLAIYGLLRLLV